MFRGLLTATLLALVLTLTVHAPAFAADPSPTLVPVSSPVLVDPLDPRAGEGASKVGAPFLALVFVIGLGATVAAGTFIFVRVARRP